MINTSTVTTKYQVVIPKNIRQILKIKSGDKVILEALGNLAILHKTTDKTWAESMKGLGKEVWENIDPLTYVQKERKTWQK